GEVTHRRKDGKILHVATQWVVHYDNEKKVRAILEVNTDITARKEAERALLQSEGFNRTILESSPDCIKVLDLDGRVVFVNPAGRKLLETGNAEMLAKSYWPGLWIGEAREQAEQAYRTALLGETAHFVGFRHTAKGTPKWWDVLLRPIHDANGIPEQILVVLRDITEHKQQQLAIAERVQLSALRADISAEIAGESPMQSTLQRISEALVTDLDLALVRIWIADETGEALTLAASAGSHSQLHGADGQVKIGAGRIGKIAQRKKSHITTDAQADPELKSPDGIHHHTLVSFCGYPLMVGERAVGVFAVYGKIPVPEAVLGELSFAAKGLAQFIHRKQTDEKLRATQAELSRYSVGLEKLVAERTAALQQLVEQMEEFSYSISHDLRAPARAMEAYANVLLEDYSEKLDATGKDYLERIIRNSTRMDRMIREILTYSRLSRCQVSLRPVELASLVREIIEQSPNIQPFCSGIEIAPDLASVMGHEPSLMQAISNLLSNACKFVPPNTAPRCKVWTERNNGHVRLFIKDNGIGIRPEHQHRLFGVFERLHPDKQYEGNGIGLAIVRKAVERMGGQVGVESDGITGSQFWIELPAASDPAPLPAAISPDQPAADLKD
ncbi:MAG TPA: ATP-binding protein, partial [Patescibacteria group bacterium]|nr:ATP-binding protein [Patescibacteria group bacterium]